MVTHSLALWMLHRGAHVSSDVHGFTAVISSMLRSGSERGAHPLHRREPSYSAEKPAAVQFVLVPHAVAANEHAPSALSTPKLGCEHG